MRNTSYKSSLMGPMIFIFVLAVSALVFMGSPSDRPLRHISQQEAGENYCPDGVASPEESQTEGTTDGKPNEYRYYRCSDGRFVNAYQR